MIFINKKENIKYFISNEFHPKFLTPISKNLTDKLNNHWDDYDEVFHCCNLIERIKKEENINIDFHVLTKDDVCVGIALASYSNIKLDIFFNSSINIKENLNDILIFNYFHISSEARGNGSVWIKEIINYYKSRDFKSIYLKSSHEKVFSLYNRLGIELEEYSSWSDNKLFLRQGKIFKIIL